MKIGVNLSVKNTVTIYLAILVFTIETIIGVLFYKQERKRAVESHYEELYHIEKSYGQILHNISRLYSYKAKLIATDKGVIKAIREKDREALLSIVSQKWEILKEENPLLKVMQFHLANGESFVRMHQLDSFGDRIADKRSMLQDIHKFNRPLSGIEVGVYYTAYRMAVPIFDNNRYIGALELGVRADMVLKRLKQFFSVNGLYLVGDRDFFKDELYQNSHLNLNLNGYKLLYSTEKNSEVLIKTIEESGVDYKDNSYILNIKDKNYLLYTLDLQDYNGKNFIKNLVYKDITADINMLNTLFIHISAVIFILTTIFILLTRYGYKKMIEQIKDLGSELETIFNTANEGIALINRDSNFVFVNRAFSTITSLSNSKLLTTNSLEIIAVEDRAEVESAIEKVRSGSVIKNLTVRYLIEDIEAIYVELSLSPMPNSEDILISIIDRTDNFKKSSKLTEYISIIDKNVMHISIDKDGYITNVTEAFLKEFGYKKSEIVKAHITLFLKGDRDRSFSDIFNSIQSGKNYWNGEITGKTNSGQTVWLDTVINQLYDLKGSITGYSIIQNNITDKKKIEELSITDPLTGLYNRRYYNTIIKQEIERLKSSDENIGSSLSFVILDVDNFKQYNDTYGHQAGDTVLKEIGKTLKALSYRSGDFSFRMGGEEFGLILRDMQIDKSIEFTEGVRRAIEGLCIEHNGNSANSKYVTASFGVATTKINEVTTEKELYREADINLYKAKESGRNRVVTTEV